MSALQMRLHALFVDAVVSLEARGVQPTARQVAKAFGQGEGFATRTLRQCVDAGLLVPRLERIAKAGGDFTVYRQP